MLKFSRNNIYIILKKLFDTIQAYISKKNYAIVKDRSKSIKSNNNFNNKINLLCDREKQSRKNNKNTKRKRKIFFIKIEYSFKANVIRKKSNNI